MCWTVVSLEKGDERKLIIKEVAYVISQLMKASWTKQNLPKITKKPQPNPLLLYETTKEI